MKKALITGITGQDGSYLTELLLDKGYEVHGIIRRASSFNTIRIDHIYESNARLKLHYGDMLDGTSLTTLINDIRPDEIYNLAAQSHVKVSFDLPDYTGDVNALGVVRLLEAVRRIKPDIKVYQASSSEMFGVSPAPQNELTPFRPISPYAISKVYAYDMCRVYREGYSLFISNGILFNHESPRRGRTFVTKKVTRGIAEILSKKRQYIELGNLEAKRDWGYAPEYVEVIWKMLQKQKPNDYVIGTGKPHSVKEFVEEAFRQVGLEWEKYIKIDEKYYRPLDIPILSADSSKAKKELGWIPFMSFEDLIKAMLDYDLQEAGVGIKR